MILFPDLRPKPAVRLRTDETTGNGGDASRKPNELAPTDTTEEETLPQSQQHLHREAGDGAASISHTTDEETSSLFDANDLSFNANSNPPATPAMTATTTTTVPLTNDDDYSSPIAVADIGSIPAESESSPTATVPPKPEAAPRESKQQKQLEEPLAE